MKQLKNIALLNDANNKKMYEPYKFYFATSVNIQWSKTFILLYLTQQCQPFTISFCIFELIKIPFSHPNHFSIEYPLILRLRIFTCTVLRFKSEFNHTFVIVLNIFCLHITVSIIIIIIMLYN
jgi:hypothetical protein